MIFTELYKDNLSCIQIQLSNRNVSIGQSIPFKMTIAEWGYVRNQQHIGGVN